MKDATKPWKRKFHQVTDRQNTGERRDVIERPKHGWTIKEDKNARTHRGKSD